MVVSSYRPFLPVTLVLTLSAAACTAVPGSGEAEASSSESSSGSEDDGPGDGDGDGPDGDGDGEASGDGDGTNAPLSYWADTKAIIDAKCVSCHVDGGIGPFALETWEQVEQWAPLLGSEIAEGSMPPWPPNASCNEYEGHRGLSTQEHDAMLSWIDADYPEGDPSQAPPAPEPPAPVEADFVVTMAEPYTPTGVPDDYRCFVIPWPEELTDPVYVTRQQTLPDQVQLVHHAITFVADADEADFYRDLDEAEPGPGYECFGGPGKLDWSARWLGAWVPGMTSLDSPPGSGVRIDPGSLLIVQFHYNSAGGPPVADQSSLAFEVVDSVERPGLFAPVLDIGWVFGWADMPIPAGETEVHHGVNLGRQDDLFNFMLAPLGVGPNDEVDIWRSALHMHLLGTHAKLSIEQDGGEEDCLLQIDDWDFNWQGDYALQEPVPFGPGDSMKLDCWYDNSAANQPLVDGEPKLPESIGWGEGTYDEMCLGGIYGARKD